MARFDSGKDFDAVNCALEMISALIPYNRARRKMAARTGIHGNWNCCRKSYCRKYWFN